MSKGVANGTLDSQSCSVCGSQARIRFSASVLLRYQASFFLCPTCGLLFTPNPFWLEEAYNSAIAKADTGILARNVRLSRIASCFLFSAGVGDRTCIDVAGGYGLFVRLMRDVGFDFLWSDPYCSNLFARGFEADQNQQATVATAFEVLEHVADPVGFIGDLFRSTKCEFLLCSTETFAGEPPAPQDWWYYAFSEGQHISFYQRETLAKIAGQLGLNLCSEGNIHLFSRTRVSPLRFRVSVNRLSSRVLFPFVRLFKKSRTMVDHTFLVQNSNRAADHSGND